MTRKYRWLAKSDHDLVIIPFKRSFLMAIRTLFSWFLPFSGHLISYPGWEKEYMPTYGSYKQINAVFKAIPVLKAAIMIAYDCL